MYYSGRCPEKGNEFRWLLLNFHSRHFDKLPHGLVNKPLIKVLFFTFSALEYQPGARAQTKKQNAWKFVEREKLRMWVFLLWKCRSNSILLKCQFLCLVANFSGWGRFQNMTLANLHFFFAGSWRHGECKTSPVSYWGMFWFHYQNKPPETLIVDSAITFGAMT